MTMKLDLNFEISPRDLINQLSDCEFIELKKAIEEQSAPIKCQPQFKNLMDAQKLAAFFNGYQNKTVEEIEKFFES